MDLWETSENVGIGCKTTLHCLIQQWILDVDVAKVLFECRGHGCHLKYQEQATTSDTNLANKKIAR